MDENREFVTCNEQFVEMWEIPDEVVDEGDERRALESVSEKVKQPEDFLGEVTSLYDHPQRAHGIIRLNNERVFESYTAPR